MVLVFDLFILIYVFGFTCKLHSDRPTKSPETGDGVTCNTLVLGCQSNPRSEGGQKRPAFATGANYISTRPDLVRFQIKFRSKSATSDPNRFSEGDCKVRRKELSLFTAVTGLALLYGSGSSLQHNMHKTVLYIISIVYLVNEWIFFLMSSTNYQVYASLEKILIIPFKLSKWLKLCAEWS